MGDFNVRNDNDSLRNLNDQYSLKHRTEVSTCFKNSERLTRTNLTLTNASKSFHSFCVKEMVLSGFHTLIITAIKAHYPIKEQK